MRLEEVTGKTEQAIQARLQHLEKELFFYKTSTRQLKKKIKELLSDALHSEKEPSSTQENRQMHNVQKPASVNKSQTHSVEVQSGTHIAMTYTKIFAEKETRTSDDSYQNRLAHQTQCSSSESEGVKKAELSQHNQIPTHVHQRVKGQSEERSEMLPVRLCRRELRQIPPADLHVSGSATRRQQSVVNTSTESVMEDSIEVLRNTDK